MLQYTLRVLLLVDWHRNSHSLSINMGRAFKSDCPSSSKNIGTVTFSFFHGYQCGRLLLRFFPHNFQDVFS